MFSFGFFSRGRRGLKVGIRRCAPTRQQRRACFEDIEPRILLAAAPLYRVNAGGDLVAGAPDWQADTAASPSPYSNALSTDNQVYLNAAANVDLTDPSVPAGTPGSIFQDERWDTGAAPEMQWTFPVTPGQYTVNLYFAEIYDGTQSVGARVFNVAIEGSTVLSNYDVFADVGGYKGVVKSFTVNSDANLNIDFAHVTENPAIKAIEIIPVASAADQLGASVTNLSYGTVASGSSSTKQITLTNLGGAGDPSIFVTSTAISGTNASQFSDNFNDAAGVVLAPGFSTTFNVTFSPTSTGAKSANLAITHDGVNTPLTIPLTGTGGSAVPVGFGKSGLLNATIQTPTSIQFGPDGKLYVSEQDGVIWQMNVTRNSANNYVASNLVKINLIHDMPNRNDNGTLNAAVTGRQVTGIYVTGTAANPVIYVASSDPRIGAGGAGTDLNLDTNSGILSRLTWNGSAWVKLDLVRGLPRSEENHGSNGIQIDPVTNTLYLAQGGHTNMGAPSNNFALLPEYALSAAILSIDLNAIGETTYDLPTLDDQTRAGTNDANDPFGGNDGLNQAKLVPGGPVQVYSPGYRNPYDIVYLGNGKMYTIDNGANAGWGDVPIGTGGNATNQVHEPGITTPDSLSLITGPGYYGGHPNPTRANPNNTFNNTNPQSPVSVGNPTEGNYLSPGAQNGALTTFPASTNGLAMYTASNFGGAMAGNLVTASFDNIVYRIQLNAAGTAVTSKTALFSSVGTTPLDVTTQGNTGAFPGTIWVTDHQQSKIWVFEPNDFGGGGGGGTGADDPNLDEDNDGYDNHDEIVNGTNPLSAGDFPHDWDADFESDLLDPNDDNDALPDTSDPFAIDAQNGKGTNLPVVYGWDNEGGGVGKLLNLGFTGLMTNGTSNYASLFDINKLTAGGAAGVLTVDEAGEGDALASLNTQTQAFQFGVNVNQNSPAFDVHTSVLGPFSGLTPQSGQSMGIFFGTGDQDNYFKLVLSGASGGGVQWVKEVAGVVTTGALTALALPGPGAVDLYLRVNPLTQTIQAAYQILSGGNTGPIINIDTPQSFPLSWITNATYAPAAGIISTSNGPAPTFPATWDFMKVEPIVAPQAVTGFTLINTTTNQPIAGFDPIPAGATINLAAIGTTSVAIRANTSPGSVGSVSFGLDGNPTFRTETASPYALHGDISGAYLAWPSPVGAHTVTATPFTGTGGTGTAGTSLTLNFTITNQPTGLPAVSIAATTSTANETTAANGVFTVTRAGSTASSLVVNYAITGSATNGTDYTTIVNSVTIPAGSASAVINVAPVNDGVAEGAETVVLTLAANANYTIGSPTTATVNIVDGTIAPQSVTSFTLINASTGQPIAGFNPIPDGATINLATIGTTNIAIRANTSPATVGSVKFGLDANANFRTENGAPYALHGDFNNVYVSWPSPVGLHTVTATPFTGSAASGTAGTPLVLSFTVTNAPAVTKAAALVQVNPTIPAGIQASTYSANSFKITNNSTSGINITSVVLDLANSVLPDMVFDPNGVAGDTLGKVFTVDTAGSAGFTSSSFAAAHDGGFDQLTVNFNGFNPGETFGFSLDQDPTSIQGSTQPGPDESGSVSGLEQIGASVTVNFSNGTSLTNNLYRTPGSLSGSQAIVDSTTALAAPTIEMLGVSAPASLGSANQTVRVTGPVGAAVSLVSIEAGLFTTGLPGGGFDLDPFEANSALGVTEYTGTIGVSGFADISVVLAKSNTNGGINHFFAVLNSGGLTGPISNKLVVQLL